MMIAVPYFVSNAPEGVKEPLFRPRLVHRLDKGTEGLQLVAKTKPVTDYE